MYINPEKYAVMAQTLRFGNVQQYFLSKRSILKGEHCYPYMGDNIDEALISAIPLRLSMLYTCCILGGLT